MLSNLKKKLRLFCKKFVNFQQSVEFSPLGQEFQVKLSGAHDIFAQCSPLVIFLNLLLQHLHLSRAVVHLASDMKLRKTITFMSLSLHLGFSLLPCRDLGVQLDAGVLTPKEQCQIHIQVFPHGSREKQ